MSKGVELNNFCVYMFVDFLSIVLFIYILTKDAFLLSKLGLCQ